MTTRRRRRRARRRADADRAPPIRRDDAGRRCPDAGRRPTGTGPATDAARAATPSAAGRIAPEALAAARGGAVEGLAWLGRTPEAKASLAVPARPAARPVRRASACSGSGSRRPARSTLPAGGYLLVAAAHRGWMDPFVVMHALPVEPRGWFLGSGPSTFTSPLARVAHPPDRRAAAGLARRRRHRAARRVGAGGDRQRRRSSSRCPRGPSAGRRAGSGRSAPAGRIIALRTDAPIVPLAMAGTEELYLGRRMASRVLPADLGPRAGRPAPDGAAARAGLARGARPGAAA